MDIRGIVALVSGAMRVADMVAGWMATYALHSTVWILLAWWLASRRSLRQAPRLQHAVWTTALVAGFVTAAVQLAGGITPLGGELRLLDGAREGMAQMRLLVQHRGPEGERLSLGEPLGATPPWVALARPQSHVRELVVVRHGVAASSSQTSDAHGTKGKETYRFNAQMPLRKRIVKNEQVVLSRHVDGSRPVSSSAMAALLQPMAAFEQSSRAGRLGPTLESSRITLPSISRDTRIEAALVTTPWSLLIVSLWGAGCALLLLRLRFARARLERTLAGRTDARFTLAGNVLRELVRHSGMKGHVALTTTDRLGSPAAIPGNEICLPRRVLAELTPLEQESLLAHELAHVIRRDTLWLRMGHLIESVAWFQPLNRLAHRRMQLAAEFAADEWAVRMTQEPLRLAKCLARVAGWLTPRSMVLAPAMVESQGSPLVQRVRRLTAPAVAPRAGGRTLTPLVLALAAVTLVALAPNIAVGRSMAGRNAAFELGNREISLLVMRGHDVAFDRRIFTRAIDPKDAAALRFVFPPNGAEE